jgi:hypothetical protein
MRIYSVVVGGLGFVVILDKFIIPFTLYVLRIELGFFSLVGFKI